MDKRIKVLMICSIVACILCAGGGVLVGAFFL